MTHILLVEDNEMLQEILVERLELRDYSVTVASDGVQCLSLAVERILTPPPAEYLPRLEKLAVDSPRTVIRHYLLANCTVEELQRLADHMGIDWEQLEGSDKRAKTRALLLYLYRRDRLAELLNALRTGGPTPS